MKLDQFKHHKSSSPVRFYEQTPLPTPSNGVIFVFGSNQRGRHGAGAARDAAWYYGAQEGCGVGLQGQSYAIPTKDFYIETLPLDKIKPYVDEFVKFTHDHPELTFMVTPVGTGLAGYTHADIAPLFKDVVNCWLPMAWRSYWANPNRIPKLSSDISP